jgi:hypothetical protein
MIKAAASPRGDTMGTSTTLVKGMELVEATCSSSNHSSSKIQRRRGPSGLALLVTAHHFCVSCDPSKHRLIHDQFSSLSSQIWSVCPAVYAVIISNNSLQWLYTKHSAIMRFDIGVSFRSLWSSTTSNDKDKKMMHWIIVIKSPTSYRTVEILPDLANATMCLICRESDPIDSDPVATYEGDLEDFEQVLRHHPMRNTDYSACFNNCQHFTATFLIFLQAWTKNYPDKHFLPVSPYRELISGVLERQGEFLWHKPNLFLMAAQAVSVPMVGGVSGAAFVASGATVTTAVPASGIFGWLGCTVSATAPAWYAGLASLAAPVFAGTTIVLWGRYIHICEMWKRDTKFVDPRIRGFPTAYRAPINATRDETGSGSPRLNDISPSNGVSGSFPTIYAAIFSAALIPIIF